MLFPIRPAHSGQVAWLTTGRGYFCEFARIELMEAWEVTVIDFDLSLQIDHATNIGIERCGS